jgi:hypothetical protein
MKVGLKRIADIFSYMLVSAYICAPMTQMITHFIHVRLSHLNIASSKQFIMAFSNEGEIVYEGVSLLCTHL